MRHRLFEKANTDRTLNAERTRVVSYRSQDSAQGEPPTHDLQCQGTVYAEHVHEKLEWIRGSSYGKSSDE